MPHPPQTDGLSERFNQTLKRMLRILITSTGSGWDKWPALTLLPTGNYHGHKQAFQCFSFSLDDKHRVPLPSQGKAGRVKQKKIMRGGPGLAFRGEARDPGPFKEQPSSFWRPPFSTCAGQATTKLSETEPSLSLHLKHNERLL